jgi:BlaI family transcriptional regulator, penicillinase repressor
MKHPVKISDAEWEVMNLVWEKSPVPASDLVERLAAKKGWQARTVRTLLDRLVKKGALAAKAEGKRYLYRSRVAAEDCARRETMSLLDRVFGGKPAALLLNLAKESELSPEEIQELKRILEEKEK